MPRASKEALEDLARTGIPVAVWARAIGYGADLYPHNST